MSNLDRFLDALGLSREDRMRMQNGDITWIELMDEQLKPIADRLYGHFENSKKHELYTLWYLAGEIEEMFMKRNFDGGSEPMYELDLMNEFPRWMSWDLLGQWAKRWDVPFHLPTDPLAVVMGAGPVFEAEPEPEPEPELEREPEPESESGSEESSDDDSIHSDDTMNSEEAEAFAEALAMSHPTSAYTPPCSRIGNLPPSAPSQKIESKQIP